MQIKQVFLRGRLHLAFVVTTDLSTDQRMARICGSLAGAGYEVSLIGRKLRDSLPLPTGLPYETKRIRCLFDKTALFYIEYNLRLFFLLLFRKMDLICAIDLDTALPCLLVSKVRGIRRVFDSHELFSEMKEVVRRPRVYRIWRIVEKIVTRSFPHGYTVGEQLALVYRQTYQVKYEVIRNLPVVTVLSRDSKEAPFVIYQGAVNEGRCFETIIPAMKHVPIPLHVYGDGNFLKQAVQLTAEVGVQDKVKFHGRVSSHKLRLITPTAYVGLNIIEKTGANNIYSLANRFFDYIHAEIPQVCVALPEYVAINQVYEVAVLIPEPTPDAISSAINRLISDGELYSRLQANCRIAKEEYNWNKEEIRLLAFYDQLLSSSD